MCILLHLIMTLVCSKGMSNSGRTVEAEVEERKMPSDVSTEIEEKKERRGTESFGHEY